MIENSLVVRTFCAVICTKYAEIGNTQKSFKNIACRLNFNIKIVDLGKTEIMYRSIYLEIISTTSFN